MSIPLNSCIILGGTGAVGKTLVKDALSSNAFTRVLTLGRRPVPVENDSSFTNLSVLEQKTIDFENIAATLPDEGKNLPQVVFCTLGTTRGAAGTAENFKKIDQHIFHPAFLKTVEPRVGIRAGEWIFGKLVPVLEFVSERSATISVASVALAMRLVGTSDSVDVQGVSPKSVGVNPKSRTKVAYFNNPNIHDIVNKYNASSKL
ncbi:Protein fmp52, mitochondrial [Mortierella sp. GBA39]|nr:Protein fmp52, mitochondrial [Mortierella sp. GBA39]